MRLSLNNTYHFIVTEILLILNFFASTALRFDFGINVGLVCPKDTSKNVYRLCILKRDEYYNKSDKFIIDQWNYKYSSKSLIFIIFILFQDIQSTTSRIYILGELLCVGYSTRTRFLFVCERYGKTWIQLRYKIYERQFQIYRGKCTVITYKYS